MVRAQELSYVASDLKPKLRSIKTMLVEMPLSKMSIEQMFQRSHPFTASLLFIDVKRVFIFDGDASDEYN